MGPVAERAGKPDPPAVRPAGADWGPLAEALRSVGRPEALPGAGGARVVEVLEAASKAVRGAVGAVLGPPAAAAGAAVVAVGALGRGESTPFADLDLVVVAPGPDGDLEPVAEAARSLWDAGIRADLAVRTVPDWLDLARSDLPSATALLDASFCGGEPAAFEALRRAVAQAAPWADRARFVARLRAEVDARHRRYGGTVYLTEPDVKHGAGGLRDLAVVRWALAAAAPPRPEGADAPSLSALLSAAGVPPTSAAPLLRAHRVLLALRAAAALATRGPGTRLSAAVQLELPAILGMVASDAPQSERRRRCEDVMQAYFRAASDVLHHGRRAIGDLAPAPPSATRRGAVPDPGEAEGAPRDPVAALRLLAAATSAGRPPRAEHLDALAALAEADDADWSPAPALAAAFFDLLEASGDGTVDGLALASDAGLLERLIPAWAKMRGKLQMEGLHALTADRHSLRAVGFLHALDRGEYDKAFPLATHLWLACNRRREVLLATLLHDVGKAIDPARQAEAGAPVARRVAADLGLGEAAADRVALLVRHHGDMPATSQRRDLTDPAVVATLARTVGSPDVLAALYLVSLADMSQVRPGYLTDWKRALLDELYLRTLRLLVRPARSPAALARRDLEGLPPRYYDAYDPDLRARNAEAVEAVRAGRMPAVVEVAPGPGALRMLVVVRDAPGLLAKIAEAFDAAGVDVLAADVFVVPGEPKVALDVFRVRRRDGDGAGWSPEELDGLARRIEAPGPPEPPPRPSAGGATGRGGPVATAVRFDEGPEHTIVEVRTPDRPGVLRRIAYALFEQGIGIHLARCSEDAGVVDDVFYVDPIPADERDHVAAAVEWWLAGG